MLVRSIGGLMTAACITSNMHWPKVLQTLASFLHYVKRMIFKLFLITIWSKNDPKWTPKWAPNGPRNRPQNGPKLDLCLRPLPETPGGAKPYKTNEKPPRRNLWGKKDGKRRVQGCHLPATTYCLETFLTAFPPLPPFTLVD